MCDLRRGFILSKRSGPTPPSRPAQSIVLITFSYFSSIAFLTDLNSDDSNSIRHKPLAQRPHNRMIPGGHDFRFNPLHLPP